MERRPPRKVDHRVENSVNNGESTTSGEGYPSLYEILRITSQQIEGRGSYLPSGSVFAIIRCVEAACLPDRVEVVDVIFQARWHFMIAWVSESQPKSVDKVPYDSRVSDRGGGRLGGHTGRSW